jgi:hypothetical protein
MIVVVVVIATGYVAFGIDGCAAVNWLACATVVGVAFKIGAVVVVVVVTPRLFSPHSIAGTMWTCIGVFVTLVVAVMHKSESNRAWCEHDIKMRRATALTLTMRCHADILLWHD